MNAIVCKAVSTTTGKAANLRECSGRDGAKDYTARYTASSTYVGSFTAIGVFLENVKCCETPSKIQNGELQIPDDAYPLLYANCCLRSVSPTTLGIASKLPDN
ncbi:hypothetical protein ALC56_09722 [Trachymyrmex septentrionalis]|uniref:Uncharacterized protein n=1 Tax=Trachymyrmex septentrionalis TaxID=34720 RepID=A0A195F6C0_9HYME|nr:hypothetical protein ALC56_09722 [Trachymyrmex septentrionalis]